MYFTIITVIINKSTIYNKLQINFSLPVFIIFYAHRAILYNNFTTNRQTFVIKPPKITFDPSCSLQVLHVSRSAVPSARVAQVVACCQSRERQCRVYGRRGVYKTSVNGVQYTWSGVHGVHDQWNLWLRVGSRMLVQPEGKEGKGDDVYRSSYRPLR